MVGNLNEAIKLAEKYRSITKEKLKETYKKILIIEGLNVIPYGEILSYITGFGNGDTCSLCKAVDGKCSKCIHSIPFRNKGITECCVDTEAYSDIENAQSFDELYEAIQRRANYLEELIREANES